MAKEERAGSVGRLLRHVRLARARVNGRESLRVAIVVGSLHRGGGCRLLAALANGLSRLGRNVCVVIPQGKPIDYPLERAVTVKEVPLLSPAYMPDADVAIANFYTTVIPAYARYGPRVLRLSLGFEPLWTPPWEEALETYRLPIPTLAISTWLAQLIRGTTGIAPAGIIHPGTDLGVFRPDPGRSFPSSQAVPSVFYLDRALSQGYEFKGGSDFWQAMAILRRWRPDVEVRVAASDGVIEDASGPYTMVKADADDELAQAYRRADVYVSSSWFEGLGLSVLEAMACATPVVSTDSGGVKDLIEDGVSGLLVPARSPRTLALAIHTVLSDPATARRLGEAGRRVAVCRPWARMAGEVDAWLDVVARREASAPSSF